MEQADSYSRAPPQRDYAYELTVTIDWGSEAVRTKLFRKRPDGSCALDKLLQYIPMMKEIEMDRKELGRQFSSHIYLFDHTVPNPPGESVYAGNKRLEHRRSMSSKLAMYALVGIPDNVALQSPEFKRLCEFLQNQPGMEQIIRIGIEQMLVCVLRRVSESLTTTPDGQRLKPDAIALTIPAQWTIEFEEKYGQMLTAAWKRVFGCPPPQLIFLGEGQTNAHYVFWRGTLEALMNRQLHLTESQQDIFSIGGTNNAVLIIDAGGHSTNTSLVTICDDGTQLEIRPDEGVIGGTAIWGLCILSQAKDSWEKKHPGRPTMPVEVENEILKLFYSMLHNFSHGSHTNLSVINCGPNRDSFAFILTPAELVRAFDDATKHSFSLIEAGMRQLKDLQPKVDKIKIMIGGGSAQGNLWIQRMRQLCTEHQMEDPIYIMQIDQEYEHARLAAGANYALAQAKSVAQFVAKAAFGLAVKKRFMTDDGWAKAWQNEAIMLWAQGNQWIRTIKTTGAEEFKIICQPEYDNPEAASTIKTDFKAYDILPVPCHKRGTVQFTFEIDTINNKLKLTLKHRKARRVGRFTDLGYVEFDLWVPPGSRTLQIWQCNEEIEATVAAAFGPNQQPAANNGPDGDVGDLPDAPPDPAGEDVEMGGVDDAQGIADTIVVASASHDASQPGHEDEDAEERPRCSRRGSRVLTGMFAR